MEKQGALTGIRRVHRAVFSKIKYSGLPRLLTTYPALRSFVYDYEASFPDRDDPIHAAAWALKELCVDPQEQRYNGFDLAARTILGEFLCGECQLHLDLDQVAPTVLGELDAGGNINTLEKLLTPE